MRLVRKTKTRMCPMPNCGKIADDASGTWYIIKAVGIACPLGWVDRVPVLRKIIDPDWGYFSYETSHIICNAHGAHGPHTVHVIDSDSFIDFLRGA